jgi:hypothetical protein
VALAASGLAKEVGLLFLPALVAALLMRKRWRLALRYTLVTLVPYAALQLWLSAWIGRSGLAGLEETFEVIPYWGYALNESAPARLLLVLFFAVPVTVLAVLAVWQLWRAPHSMPAWALLVNCLFIIFIARRTAADVLAMFRVATGVLMAGLQFAADRRLRWVAFGLHALWLPPLILALLIPGFVI